MQHPNKLTINQPDMLTTVLPTRLTNQPICRCIYLFKLWWVL